MSTVSQILLLIIQTLGTLYLIVILARFLFQAVRADYYNPISQAVVKLSNPLLVPLRRVIPGLGGLDLAAVTLALLWQLLIIELSALVLGAGLLNPLPLLLVAALGLVGLLLKLYFWFLIIIIIASFIAPYSSHPALVLLRQLTEPVMAPLRKILPPMGGLDFTPILAFLVLQVLMMVVNGVANSLNPLLPMGVGVLAQFTPGLPASLF